MKKNQKVTYIKFFHSLAEALFVVAATCIVIAAIIVIYDPALYLTGYLGAAGFTAMGLGLLSFYAHVEVTRGVQMAKYIDRDGTEMTHVWRTR